MKKVLKYISDYLKKLDKAMLLLCAAVSAFSVFLLYTEGSAEPAGIPARR